ncbi:BNR repeat-containing protein [Dysgonomonas sp. Marseille-P4677]|uniref:BNR repeat-containing protein n=1 Tax=Dysgonomonas sp. Marseille-P4677 TaxID=2364790 RepID=UPI00191356E4|nr:BNR repeat-containing protein [Dysgonomonas sp. Marseille-P4677]MBK5722725.1 BNR repeat-containing protein [Dysgonomonas sp. Marseille-P4677]
MNSKIYAVLITVFISISIQAQKLVPVANGWSNNSVNVTVFRKNSLVTHRDTQFIAYYDPDGFLTLGKRNIGTEKWEINKTQYKGNVSDAHNSISIMADGNGYLHVSWDHHGHPLRYAKSKTPYSLELTDKLSMTGSHETNVTYPEFFKMPDGNLVFMYRDGQSGRGNLVLNSYNVQTQEWTQLHKNLIDGQGKRNAYWQACVDNKNVIHLSWVWRETPDVATNHDLCYARSEDGGMTWISSQGKKYTLPITSEKSEIACHIPQNSELINQTSMTTDSKGNPYIATYWRSQDTEIPQYHIVYNDGKKWNNLDLGFRKIPFSLKGVGTKRIPVSRPQVMAHIRGKSISLYLLFRDEERLEKVSVAVCKNIKKNKWKIQDLTDFPVGSWEPSYDTELWRDRNKLNVFVQKVEQVDGEGKADIEPQKVYVLEID